MVNIMINTKLLLESLPLLVNGAKISLGIAFGALCLGLLGGTILAIAQRASIKLIKFLASSYINLVRGTPMLIQIWLMLSIFSYFGVWNLLAVAIFAIGLNSAAYMSQTIKGGIDAVGKGQLEAASVLGLNDFQKWRLIILPQAFRAIISPLSNEIITLIKDSSLASVIGVTELLKAGKNIISITYDPFTIYLGIGLLYLLLTGVVAFIFGLIERKIKHA
jgi:His/Glu/Gln/Arg/opine family amino acid ABC transporter permease subunit